MKILATAFVFFLSSLAMASDFYVITSTHKIQEEAQQKAAESGGWVLVSNFYKSLTPNTFAVVRGPFKSHKEADQELKSLKDLGKEFSKAYSKNAGDIDLNGIAGSKKLPPQVIAAILGEVQIANEVTTGRTPCEPQGTYNDYSLTFHTVERGADNSGKDTFKAKRVKLDIGSLTQTKATGEISRMRICAE